MANKICVRLRFMPLEFNKPTSNLLNLFIAKKYRHQNQGCPEPTFKITWAVGNG